MTIPPCFSVRPACPRIALSILLFLLLAFSSFSVAQTVLPPSARPTDLTHDKNLYAVGYSHLDTQWRWTYETVIREYIPNTMRQNFPLLERYPGYVFNFTGSRRYEFMKEYYPADYAKVKVWVAKGRWFPAGSSVDEGDAIVPSLESLVRQTLYGNRFFDREFGLHSDEFMLPDCFGFPAGLPSVLAHCGIKGFSTQKLTWKSAVGIPFPLGVWEGPDGQSIVAAFDPGNYAGTVTGDLSRSENWQKRIDQTGAKSGVFADYHYYGVGDRGGAPLAASVELIEKAQHSDGPVRVISDRADRLFNEITPEQKEKLPRYKGELLLIEHSTGSITSQAYVKRWNRKNELLADAAERAASMASWFGALPYPREKLYRSWDLLLGSQMHDILPGTSLPEAYNFSWNDEILAANQFAEITESSSAAVISALDTQAQGVPLVIYNPLSIEREDVVEAEVSFPAEAPAEISVFDSAGKEVPSQIVSRTGKTLKLLALAKVPSVGYATFDVRPGKALASALKITANSLENDRYKVDLDQNGDVSSIFDKTSGKELLRAPIQLGIHTEIPAEKPAWHMDWSDRQKPARAFVGGVPNIRIVESGPARVALEISRQTEGSTFVQQVRLASGGNRVEFTNLIDWRTQKASLRAAFPLTVSNPFATYDAQVGTVSRDNNNPKKFEHPQQQWLDLTNSAADYGVSVLNDCKYGSDKPSDDTVRLTLLHTPGWRKGQTRDQETQDIGRHEMLFAVVGHVGDWAKSGVSWEAARMNQPLIPFTTPAHPGSLGRSFSLLNLNTDQVSVVAVKMAEDNEELIVRVKELTGKPASNIRFAIRGELLSAREMNGQEREISGAKVDSGQLVFDLAPYALKAFSLKLGKSAATVPAVASQSLALDYDLDAASTDEQRSDGNFDGQGNTFPAEQLPDKLVREGVSFQLGSTLPGAKNAVTARGQTIQLPAGFNRIYLLAAAKNDDHPVELTIGNQSHPFTAQSWRGYIGQWDSRLWSGKLLDVDYLYYHPMTGLEPGFVKRAPVAWFATHYHTPLKNTYYRFSYLFKHGFDLPQGATTLTLPNTEGLAIFSISVARESGAGVEAAAPLYDTLKSHSFGTDGKPNIADAGQVFHDETAVTIEPPLYYRPGDLHYTLDGSEPTAASASYSTPISINRPTTLKVRQLTPGGKFGETESKLIQVDDQTPPSVTSAAVQPNGVMVQFSETLDPKLASDVANFQLEPKVELRSAQVQADRRSVLLLPLEPLLNDQSYQMNVRNLADTSPLANRLTNGNITIPPAQVFHHSSVQLPDAVFTEKINNLPLKGSDPWTLHFFIKPKEKTAGKVLLAGFGSANPKTAEEGQGRFLASYEDGIRFWARGRDYATNSPLEIGRWQLLTAVYDGQTLTIYKDAQVIGKNDLMLVDDSVDTVHVAPLNAFSDSSRPIGEMRDITLLRKAADGSEIKAFYQAKLPRD